MSLNDEQQHKKFVESFINSSMVFISLAASVSEDPRKPIDILMNIIEKHQPKNKDTTLEEQYLSLMMAYKEIVDYCKIALDNPAFISDTFVLKTDF